MKTKTRRIALLGILTSVSLVLSYIEAILPPLWSAVPGIKMGLPNIIIVLLLYRFSFRDAAVVSLIRISIMSLLFGNAMIFIYSFAGAALSLFVMATFKKMDFLSTVGVSITGGVTHNLGQIIVAIIIMQTKEIGYYMIVLAITGTIAGVLIGIVSSVVLRYFKKLRL